MRRRKAMSIGDALGMLVQSNGMQGKYLEYKLMKAFPEVAGAEIASKVKSLHIKNGVLYVSLLSSVARMELIAAKSALVPELNEKAGALVIRDMVLL